MSTKQKKVTILVAGCLFLITALTSVSYGQRKEEEIPPSFIDSIDMIVVGFGPQMFSRNVEETLSPAWRFSALEFYYALPFLRMLRIGINALGGSKHEYLLTPSEKDAISRYVIVTVMDIGGLKTESREPLTELPTLLNSQSFIARLYPISKGISPPSMKADIEPFIGAGVIRYTLTAQLPAKAKGFTTGKGSGFSTFLNVGMDFVLIDFLLKGEIFLRIEYLMGRLPDWSVKLLPELRPIEGGKHSVLKIGIGFALRGRPD